MIKCRDVAAEIRRVLILLRRKFRDFHRRGKICSDCYDIIISVVQNRKLKPEEYECEEALRRWG